MLELSGDIPSSMDLSKKVVLEAENLFAQRHDQEDPLYLTLTKVTMTRLDDDEGDDPCLGDEARSWGDLEIDPDYILGSHLAMNSLKFSCRSW
jgi:hypothetical protein